MIKIVHFIIMLLMVFLTLSILLLSSGCKKREYEAKELWIMAKKIDSGLAMALPDKEYPEVFCPIYGAGCMYTIRVKLKGLTMLVVRFDNEEHAKRAAVKLDGFYKYNWMFDEITTEPILQDFVIRAFGAIRARDEVKDISFPSTTNESPNTPSSQSPQSHSQPHSPTH